MLSLVTLVPRMEMDALDGLFLSYRGNLSCKRAEIILIATLSFSFSRKKRVRGERQVVKTLLGVILIAYTQENKCSKGPRR